MAAARRLEIMNNNIWLSAEDFDCYALSERAITLEFGSEGSPKTTRNIRRLYYELTQKPFPGFYAAIPAYTSLSVFYDPIQVLNAHNSNGNTAFSRVKEYLEKLWIETLGKEIPESTPTQEALGKIISIPICYGGEFGPDLDEVASNAGLSPEEIVNIHSEQVYEVSMIGFMPGFTYLSGLPEILNCPRKQQPRPNVPAGSVGIAGSQTGIYALDTPGGWQIIGQISWKLFDPDRTPPVLLNIGDSVRFIESDHQ